MRIAKIKNIEIHIETFAIVLRETTTREIAICFNGIFASNFVRSSPVKSTRFQFLKANNDSFSKIFVLPPPSLSQPLTLFL